MAGELAKSRCEGRKPLHPWKANHLYVGDDGQILCGSCMGIESTYRPWGWSDLGPMAPDRTVTLPAMKIEIGRGRWVEREATAYRCETDQYARPKSH